MESRVQQRVLRGRAAVGDAEEDEVFGEVVGRVPSDSELEGAGAQERPGEHHAAKRRHQQAERRLVEVSAVSEAEEGAAENGGGPEAEGARQLDEDEGSERRDAPLDADVPSSAGYPPGMMLRLLGSMLAMTFARKGPIRL
jgi:hypothetical protein